MKKVIVATDLSLAAQNAALYAAHFAKTYDLEIILFTAYTIPFSQPLTSVPLENKKDVEDLVLQNLEAEKDHLEKEVPNLKYTLHIAEGDVVECLKKEVAATGADLVIIGTVGETDSVGWGSVATRILRTLPVLTLAIPRHTQWVPLEYLVLAIDYKNIPLGLPVEKLKSILDALHAKLAILNVTKPGKVEDAPALFQTAFKELSPKYFSCEAEETEEGIQAFLSQYKVEWLIVVPQEYGFFEHIFHVSQTKQLTKYSSEPILSLHAD